MAAPDGSGLAVAPAQLPALQAGLLDGRRAGPGFTRGMWTSALTRGIQSSRSFYGRLGWNYHDTWAAGDYPTCPADHGRGRGRVVLPR
jgi:hypothetical protein